MSDMVRVPAEKIAALREELRHLDACTCGADPLLLHGFDIAEAARAVVDAVETEPPTLTNSKGSALESPARDDAEKAIADE